MEDCVLFSPETAVVNKDIAIDAIRNEITKVTTGMSVLVFELASATIRDAEIITDAKAARSS